MAGVVGLDGGAPEVELGVVLPLEGADTDGDTIETPGTATNWESWFDGSR